MIIAIGIAAVLTLRLINRRAHARLGRDERMGLNYYAHKAHCEVSFPFDYLSR